LTTTSAGRPAGRDRRRAGRRVASSPRFRLASRSPPRAHGPRRRGAGGAENWTSRLRRCCQRCYVWGAARNDRREEPAGCFCGGDDTLADEGRDFAGSVFVAEPTKRRHHRRGGGCARSAPTCALRLSAQRGRGEFLDMPGGRRPTSCTSVRRAPRSFAWWSAANRSRSVPLRRGNAVWVPRCGARAQRYEPR